MIDLLYLIIGFVLLFVSGKYLVHGGVELAKIFKVPPLVVGLTIVSFGTSAPELLVSIKAALNGHPDISMGNVVGSNIGNIALVLGITAIVFPLPVAKKLIRFDWPVLMLISLALFALAYNGLITGLEGILLFAALIAFNVFTVYTGKNEEQEEQEEAGLKWYWALGIMVLTSIGLIYGADLLVKGATGLAREVGVSERIISVSIIAFGTSVPELATSIVAALRKETDISIGNIIGSNIFNLAGIIGITSMVKSIPVSAKIIHSDMIWMLSITVLLFIVMIVGKSKKITRFNGIILLSSYCLYLFFLLT